MQRIMRGKNTEKKGMKDVEKTNQVGPMKAHGAIRQWANVVLPTVAQQK